MPDIPDGHERPEVLQNQQSPETKAQADWERWKLSDEEQRHLFASVKSLIEQGVIVPEPDAEEDE